MRTVTMHTEPKDQAHRLVSAKSSRSCLSAVLRNREKLAEVRGFLARVDTPTYPDSTNCPWPPDVPAASAGLAVASAPTTFKLAFSFSCASGTAVRTAVADRAFRS